MAEDRKGRVEAEAGSEEYPARDWDAEERRLAKRSFWYRIGALVAIVFAFLLYLELAYSYSRYWEGYVAGALGGTVAVLLMSGVVPMLWFAVLRRFDYRRYAGPLILWYVLALIVIGMNYSAESFRHCLESRPMEECLSR